MEQPAAPAVEGLLPEPLTEANLQRFAQLHPANARQTVKLHLLDQKTRTYPTQQLENTITPAPPAPAPSRAPARPSPNNNADTALVLMRGAEAGPSGEVKLERDTPVDSLKKRERDSSEGPRRKKPTLVGAMRPRTSSLPLGSPRTLPAAVKRSERSKARIDEGASDSSPLLVARAGEHKDPAQADESPAQRNKEKAREETSEHAATHVQPPAQAKPKAANSAARAKAVAAREKADAFESDEEAEHAARLEARRQRRLAKALVVKDRTQSAAATGAAAASKLKARTSRGKKEKHKTKRKRKADAASDESGGDDDSDDDERSGMKKRRKVSTAETNKLVQNTKKAANVSGSRLTMQPAIKLGLFHKGAASVRTKIGSKLPDLAFSELNFLNAPRPDPPASESSSHSSSSSSSTGSDESNARGKATRKRAPAPPAVVITYGKAKKKGRSSKRASKYFDEPDSAPPPPPRAPSPRKSKRTSRAPPADADSPKASSPPPRHARTVEKQTHPPLPAPPISDLASVSRPSDHSAHSLAVAAAARKRPPSPSIEREASEAFMDTSKMWVAPAQKVQERNTRAYSPPPPRQAASPHNSSGSDSHLDRLIKVCLDGRVFDSESRRERSEVPETTGEGSSFLRSPAPRHRAPSRPSESRDWVPAGHYEDDSAWPQQQYQAGGAGEDDCDDFDADYHPRDEREAFADREAVGGWLERGSNFPSDPDRPFQAPGPTFVGGQQRRMEFDAAGPLSREDDQASECWRTESQTYGGRLHDDAAEQADPWPAPERASRFLAHDAGPSRAPYAFEFDPSYSRLHNLDRNSRATGDGRLAGTDSPEFREAMANHWFRSRP